MSTLKPTATHLTSGHLLARNTLWSVGANVASIAVAIFSVPILLRYLGTDRFGVISLIWIVEGQFGIFDLGLGSALTKLVAESLGSSQESDIPPMFWSSILIMGIFGLIGSIVLWLSATWLVHSVLRVPLAIQLETVSAFHLVAISLPVVISTGALRGFLAAHQRFDLLSITRVPLSLFSYLIPLVVLPFSHSLAPFVLVMVIARFVTWMVYLGMSLYVMPSLRKAITIRGAPVNRMLGFGGWMTVTNIVSPIMVNLDRLLIGSLISMAAVAYYSTPYEAATKLWIIPSCMTGVLFPAFSTALVHDRRRAALLFEKGIKYIFISLFPITISGLALGGFILHVWLGPAFAQKSTLVLQCLLLGVFANSLAQVPFWQIQAAHRPDLAAKVHLLELPCYLTIFWFLTKAYGIEGAGWAWMLRGTIDAVIMFWMSNRLLPESRPSVRRLANMCIIAAPLLATATVIRSAAVAAVFVGVVWAAFIIVSWNWLLTPQERGLAKNPVRLVTFREAASVAEI